MQKTIKCPYCEGGMQIKLVDMPGKRRKEEVKSICKVCNGWDEISVELDEEQKQVGGENNKT